jgi:plastocyanin
MASLMFLLGPAGVFAASHPTHTIKIENMMFAMGSEVSIKSGDTVVWQNADLVPHTVTAEDGSFDSKVIDPGKSWKFTFKKAGKIAYHCLLHPTMHAQLTVK